MKKEKLKKQSYYRQQPKTKHQTPKGITLVALVITIIILLILAGVAISMITGGDGLFSRADNAATRYNETAENESIKLNELMGILNEYGGEILEDTVDPSVATLVVEENSITHEGFTLTATGEDGESGIATYEFYVKNAAGEYELEKTIESTNTTETYEVTGKSVGTSYTYKVIVYDRAKNDKTSTEITVKTSEIANLASVGLHELTIESAGKYKLEVWGAQGGGYGSKCIGGKGGYSVGTVTLTKGTKLYIYVGGTTTNAEGGFNGGGSAIEADYAGGGGGTDIRINEDSLYARVIVAGGGGGGAVDYPSSSAETVYGGAGGGTDGQAGIGGDGQGGGGSQTSGGKIADTHSTAGTFGIGGSKNHGGENLGGGGGGWYGGGSGTGSSNNGPGGGGSGYVYTSSTASSYPSGCLLNSSYYLTSASTIAGTSEFLSPNGVSETGHSGNGYARITRVQ